ncbi:MAG: isocitrate lyase/PEP mutase family protein [Rhodobacteraceae bacterium]|nr:isocitrate lyase/PEP mutase family protein [Paracoccaceae bacterium]
MPPHISAPDRLRALLTEDRLLVLPCPYDGLSARLVARAGYRSAFMGGYAVAAGRFGWPDIGIVSPTEMLETARSIIRASGLPILVDGDTGYGGDANIARTIADLAQADAAAVMIEDQTWPKRCGHIAGKQVVGRDEAIARIRAAVAARDASCSRPLILARTDARGVLGMEEALARVRAFAEAGADLLFLEAPETEAEMRAFTTATPLPCLANMLAGGRTPRLSPDRLQQLGFAMAAFPLDLIGAAAAALEEALAHLGGEGGPAARDHGQLLEITGFTENRA